MSELYDKLLDRGASLTGEEALMQAFACAATELRAWKAGSLATSELEDGLWVDEADEADIDRDLGALAAEGAARPLPCTYRGGPWVLRVGLDAQGAPYAELLEGPGPASLPALEVDLSLGQRSALEFPETPDQLTLVDGSGREWTLS